jgi:hypothetical protein
MANELNGLIDKKLHGCAPFKHKELIISNECLDFYCHDILTCIRGLFGDPTFASDLIFFPEWLYTNCEQTEHVYNKINTGNWWWAVQVHNKIFQSISYLMTSARLLLNHTNQAPQLFPSFFPPIKHRSQYSMARQHIQCI